MVTANVLSRSMHTFRSRGVQKLDANCPCFYGVSLFYPFLAFVRNHLNTPGIAGPKLLL